MPGFLNDVAKLAKFTGQQKQVDDLITAMNRAAEAAVPEAKALLVGAINSMSIHDGRQILTGGDNSVTQFFSSKTRAPLSVKFLPIVTKATEKVSLAEKYNALAGKAASTGLVSKARVFNAGVPFRTAAVSPFTYPATLKVRDGLTAP